tara:strand:- start:6525 stop:6872 length:348 start_codon:yes stop_codon:yes gene_type:complete
MKYFFVALIYIFMSCNSESKNNSIDSIISKKKFTTILKEVQLAESSFELNKRKDIDYAEKKLNNDYIEIYNKYNITKKDFEKTLNYYIKNSEEELLLIYTEIINQLEKEKSNLNH